MRSVGQIVDFSRKHARVFLDRSLKPRPRHCKPHHGVCLRLAEESCRLASGLHATLIRCTRGPPDVAQAVSVVERPLVCHVPFFFPPGLKLCRQNVTCFSTLACASTKPLGLCESWFQAPEAFQFLMLLFVCMFTFCVLGMQLYGGLVVSDPDSPVNDRIKVPKEGEINAARCRRRFQQESMVGDSKPKRTQQVGRCCCRCLHLLDLSFHYLIVSN